MKMKERRQARREERQADRGEDGERGKKKGERKGKRGDGENEGGSRERRERMTPAERFAQADTDGSGGLSLDEFLAMEGKRHHPKGKGDGEKRERKAERKAQKRKPYSNNFWYSL